MKTVDYSVLPFPWPSLPSPVLSMPLLCLCGAKSLFPSSAIPNQSYIPLLIHDCIQTPPSLSCVQLDLLDLLAVLKWWVKIVAFSPLYSSFFQECSQLLCFAGEGKEELWWELGGIIWTGRFLVLYHPLLLVLCCSQTLESCWHNWNMPGIPLPMGLLADG